ncbi:MAG: hypothetical protein NVSMB34_14780 [Variovorax sp.]
MHRADSVRDFKRGSGTAQPLSGDTESENALEAVAAGPKNMLAVRLWKALINRGEIVHALEALELRYQRE